MNRILNETMAEKKADPAFEQRMVSRFRDRVPKRASLVGLFIYLMQVHALTLSAIAAMMLLALVGSGGWLTSASG